MEVFVEVNGVRFSVPDHISKRLGDYTRTVVDRTAEGMCLPAEPTTDYVGSIAQERLARTLDKYLPE